MLHAGVSTAAVAYQFQCSQRAIQGLNQHFNETGRTSDRPRTGRPQVTTPREDQYLWNIQQKERFLTVTSSSTNALDRHVSHHTVIRRLREGGIRAYRPYRVLLLTDRHKLLRLQWATHHRCWALCDWHRVMFSNESRFCLSRADSRVRLYRRRNERYAQNCLLQAEPYGGGSVMVWCVICREQKSQLIIV